MQNGVKHHPVTNISKTPVTIFNRLKTSKKIPIGGKTKKRKMKNKRGI